MLIGQPKEIIMDTETILLLNDTLLIFLNIFIWVKKKWNIKR